jgi:hypothetical protein
MLIVHTAVKLKVIIHLIVRIMILLKITCKIDMRNNR